MRFYEQKYITSLLEENLKTNNLTIWSKYF